MAEVRKECDRVRTDLEARRFMEEQHRAYIFVRGSHPSQVIGYAFSTWCREGTLLFTTMTASPKVKFLNGAPAACVLTTEDDVRPMLSLELSGILSVEQPTLGMLETEVRGADLGRSVDDRFRERIRRELAAGTRTLVRLRPTQLGRVRCAETG